MRKTAQEKKVPKLEAEKLYNNDTFEIENAHYHEVEKDYSYLKNGFFFGFVGAVARGLINIILPFYTFFTYRLKIEGKENLKSIKKTGAICISNHSQFLDAGIMKRVLLPRKTYITLGITNNKNGFTGKFLKSIGCFPLSNMFSAQKKLNDAISTVLKKNKIVTFNPEHSMWKNYRKPRPFKKGAFYYAVKNNVPIVPIIILNRANKKIDKVFNRKNRLTAKVLPPIYPNMQLNEKNRVEFMKDEAQYMFNLEYKKFYGIDNDVLEIKNPYENIKKYEE
jgi:1-acyl-sn-glycerol-3-phosphate acyltransferase